MKEALITITALDTHESSNRHVLQKHHPVSILISSHTNIGLKALEDRVYRCIARLQNIISGKAKQTSFVNTRSRMKNKFIIHTTPVTRPSSPPPTYPPTHPPSPMHAHDVRLIPFK